MLVRENTQRGQPHIGRLPNSQLDMTHQKKIDILRVTHLRGPNIWTYRPVIEALIDIAGQRLAGWRGRVQRLDLKASQGNAAPWISVGDVGIDAVWAGEPARLEVVSWCACRAG